MTESEIKLIQTQDFRFLWEYFLINFYSSKNDTRKDFESANNKFKQICTAENNDGILHNINYFIEKIKKIFIQNLNGDFKRLGEI